MPIDTIRLDDVVDWILIYLETAMAVLFMDDIIEN